MNRMNLILVLIITVFLIGMIGGGLLSLTSRATVGIGGSMVNIYVSDIPTYEGILLFGDLVLFVFVFGLIIYIISKMVKSRKYNSIK
ncbi:MAG: hypothetical protein V1815_03190 [Candidatus Woesearchaeota archaeon]